MSHFEFTDINNMVLKNGGTVAAPRSKRNVRYVAPRNLPMNTFGEITTGEGLFLGASAPVILAATAGLYGVGGMFSAWSQEFSLAISVIYLTELSSSETLFLAVSSDFSQSEA